MLKMLHKAPLVSLCLAVGGCFGGGCERYASEYPCSYVVDEATYEVWYWRHLENDNPDDEKLIGTAIGIRMCEQNAQAYATSLGEQFNYRAYICVLMDKGERMEKHRNLED